MPMKQSEFKMYAIYLGSFVLLGLIIMYFFTMKPENDNIESENERLTHIENKLLEAIAENDTTKAKAFLIQLRWQYEPSSVGGQSEVDELRKIWNNKRREYLKLIGENPEDYDFDSVKRGIKAQWEEFINE